MFEALEVLVVAGRDVCVRGTDHRPADHDLDEPPHGNEVGHDTDDGDRHGADGVGRGEEREEYPHAG